MLEQIFSFTQTGRFQATEGLYRAETRSEISARLAAWVKLMQQNGFSEETAALWSSVVGEIANNAFDHNLGKWQDAVGCLVGFDFLPGRLRVVVVDRGQGIVSSLKGVRPNLKDPSDYLTIAFEQIISGRAPEQRGNGLKYVKKNFEREDGFALLCFSSGCVYKLGADDRLWTQLQGISGFQGTLVALDLKREA